MPKFSFVIPFRDRHQHLSVLVPHIRALNLDAEIVVSEQVNDKPLRRGALRNEGVRYSRGDIVILHDVDYVPDINTVYWTDESNVFRAVRKAEFVDMDFKPRNENDTPSGYRTFKDGIDDNFYGGVLCVERETFYEINGYNPLYEGWGLEDDDFRERIRHNNNVSVTSSRNNVFRVLQHPDSFRNDELFQRSRQLFSAREAFYQEGIKTIASISKINTRKAAEYGVDVWVETYDWPDRTQKSSNTTPWITLDYGSFLLSDDASEDHVQRTIKSGNRWEPDVMALCEKYVIPGSNVIDIGANIGSFTVRLAQLTGPTGTVYAYEPQRLVYQQLCGNIFLNKLTNVRAKQIALSDKFGQVTLSKNTDKPGEVRIVYDYGGEIVACEPLDEILMMVNNVSLIKMDVERYEPYVFKGAHELIQRNRPVILFELTTLPLPEFPSNYVLDMLKSFDYNVYQINDAGDYLGVPREKDDNE